MPRNSDVAGAKNKNGAAATASLAKTPGVNGGEFRRIARTSARVASHAGRRFLGADARPPDRPHGQGGRHIQRDRRRQPAHGQAARARGPGRWPRRQDPSTRALRSFRRRLGRDGILRQLADRRPAVADDGGNARDRRRGAGRSASHCQSRRRRPATKRRIPAGRRDRQHDDQAAQRLHLRGDARRARGRHRRQARRPSPGRRRHRRVEGPYRERQLDGVESHRPSAQHRRGDDRGRQRRLVEEDYRRRPRRDFAAQGSHQHDGRSAALVRFRSDPRRP